MAAIWKKMWIFAQVNRSTHSYEIKNPGLAGMKGVWISIYGAISYKMNWPWKMNIVAYAGLP